MDKTSDEVVFTVSPHGNSKKSTVPFYPIKKSTMKDDLTFKSPAVAFMNAVKSAGGIVGARDSGELPRSKRQVYDLNRNMKKTDQVDELLQYSKHREEAIVIEHHDVPEDLWVLGKSHMTNDLSRFCTSELVNHPFSVDPTFNFGQYEVTPFTYKHLFLKSKRTGLAPTFVGPTAIHHSKQKSVYKKIVSTVVNTSPHLSKNAKGFITDGEQALHDSLKEDLKHATGLRCFRHFYQNCKDKLCSLKIRTKKEQKFFLHKVFDDSGSGDGILDAIDKSNLKRRLSAAEEPLKKEEEKFTGADTSGFWLYLHGQRSMMKKCMIADARNKAGMPCDSSGVPLRCYTNQSESVNNKLTRQKEAIVKNDKNKVNLTKLQFKRDVWEEVDKHQQEELEMAICGLSQEFELLDMVCHLEHPADEWFEMTSQQRKCCFKI